MDYHAFWSQKCSIPISKSNGNVVSATLDQCINLCCDILLFSKDEESYEKLLTEFYNLVKSQGIMLSKKKTVIGQSSINFFKVNILDGKYTLQPHIAVSLGARQAHKYQTDTIVFWNY